MMSTMARQGLRMIHHLRLPLLEPQFTGTRIPPYGMIALGFRKVGSLGTTHIIRERSVTWNRSFCKDKVLRFFFSFFFSPLFSFLFFFFLFLLLYYQASQNRVGEVQSD